jgi:hypothetical protein
MDQDKEMALTFRCPPELTAILPRPIPAVQGLPNWFKELPQKSFNPIAQSETQTVKRCPPFIDAMTYGFLMLLVCDLKVEKGEFSWELDFPHGGKSKYARSPISFHDPSQVIDSPYYEQDRVVIKFHNFWTIESPPGYSLLFTHPLNRPDLPFTTLTGLVDSDLYRQNWIHFPAQWHDPDFTGILAKGTPVAQCIPVKRETWTSRVDTLSDDDAVQINVLASEIAAESGIYRRQFRAAKR